VSSTLVHNPHPKGLVILALVWHQAMAILSFELDQLFTVLVPELVVWFECVSDVTFPSKPNSVQNLISIEPNFVTCMIVRLMTDPRPP
jgi:hypothetical protein